MRKCFCAAIAGAIAWVATGAMQPAAGQSVSAGSLQVKAVNLVEIDSSHVKANVDLVLIPAQSTTLDSLRLCSLRVNGLPVFAAPVNQEIVLRKGEPVALPPLYVTVLYRDLYTVEPLRQMLETQSVRVQGELQAGLHLSFLEKLMLHTQRPNVNLGFDEQVPVKTGDAPLERNVELGMLSVIESGLEAKSKVEKLVPDALRPAWIRDLEAQAPETLFEVESSYALTKGEASYSVELSEIGFRLSTARIVSSGEAWEPWKYDPDFLGAVKSNTVKLDKKGQEIQLWPMAQGVMPLKLSARDFTVDTPTGADDDSITAVSPDHKAIKVMRRDSPNSIAVFVLQTPPAKPGLAIAPATVIAGNEWDQVAVFRLRINQATHERAVDVLRMAARREGQGLRLSEPVDSSVFGSPIMTPDGVIGVVQDEQRGAFLPSSAQSVAQLP